MVWRRVGVLVAVLVDVFTGFFLMGVLVVKVFLATALLVTVVLGAIVVLFTLAGLRAACLDNIGVAKTGMVATLNSPTPTHVRNFLLNIMIS